MYRGPKQPAANPNRRRPSTGRSFLDREVRDEHRALLVCNTAEREGDRVSRLMHPALSCSIRCVSVCSGISVQAIVASSLQSAARVRTKLPTRLSAPAVIPLHLRLSPLSASTCRLLLGTVCPQPYIRTLVNRQFIRAYLRLPMSRSPTPVGIERGIHSVSAAVTHWHSRPLACEGAIDHSCLH